MRSDRSRQADEHEPERNPEPAIPGEHHALLALQRSAGNAAVGQMLARKFYAREGDGKLVWHPEALDEGQWEDSGDTARWLIWTYPVYQRRTAPADEAPAPARKKRRPRKKKKAAVAPEASATPELAEDEPEDAVEDETEVAGPDEAPPPILDDGGGWSEVKSDAAAKKERDRAADADALAREVDGHGGAPAVIVEKFNSLFNARVAQRLDVMGAITDSYTTRFDRARGGYSIEVTIPGLANWVVHAHLNADGTVADGDNATHYKRAAERFDLGVSVALLPKQIAAMLPDQATRLTWQTTTRRGTI